MVVLLKTKNSTLVEGDCEVSLRSSSQQSPGIYVKCDRLQPRIELVTWICHLCAVPLGHVADIDLQRYNVVVVRICHLKCCIYSPLHKVDLAPFIVHVAENSCVP